MSGGARSAHCGLRSLRESVSEQLSRVGEEIMEMLERRGGRSVVRLLRLLLSERLAAAAEQIAGLLEQEVEEYRRKLERQGRLLDAMLNPVVRLDRTGEIQPVWGKSFFRHSH